MRRASNPSSRPAEPKPSRRVAPYGTNQVDVAGTSRPGKVAISSFNNDSLKSHLEFILPNLFTVVKLNVPLMFRTIL